MKTIFMGTPPFAATILEMFCDKMDPPLAVVTQEAKAIGRGHKITPSAVEYYAKGEELMILPTDNVNLPANISLLKTLHPDLILVAAFGQILKPEVLQIPKLFCLNVHASLLPKYRGAAPVHRAIFNGDAVTGITIQKMERKLDTGDILLKRELAIEPNENSSELMQRLAHLGGECLVEAVQMVESGKYSFTPQDHAAATYAAKVTKKDGPLDFNKAARQLHNQVRALHPWPIAETTLGQARAKIFKSEVIRGEKGKQPGDVLTDGKTFLAVQCHGEEALSLTEIQLENKKRLEIKDFLAGFRGHNIPSKAGISA